MSAPADRDASQLYYSYRIIKRGGGGGGGGMGGGGGGGGWGEREILAAVTQSDLSRSHVSWRGGGGGGGGGGRGVWLLRMTAERR